MVKKVIDIIPPDNWPANKISSSGTGKNMRAVPLPDNPAAAGYGREARPNLRFQSQEFADDKQGSVFSSGEEKAGRFWKGLFWQLALVAAIIFFAMWGLDAKFAKAVVKVWPETADLRQDLKVMVDDSIGEINKADNLIPGFVIAAEKTIESQSLATGSKDSQGKAQGMVKLFNNYTAPQRLVKGTRLQAPLEKFQPALAGDETPWFRTAESVVLAPKSSLVVAVTADGTGEKYNIDPTVFSVPGLAGTAQYTFIYGQSFEKFAGGSSDRAPEVKKEDLETAKTEIEKFAKEEIQKELEAKIKEQALEIIDSGIIKFEFGKAEILAKAGDSIAKIPTKINAKATAVAYKKSDLEALGREFALNQIPAGNIIKENSLKFETSFAGTETGGGRPMLALAIKMTTYRGMESENLKKGLSEKKADEAKMFLMSQPGTKEAKIELTPFWRTTVPRNLDRIDVLTILD